MTVSGVALPCLRVGVIIYFPYMGWQQESDSPKLSGVMLDVNNIIATKLNRCIDYVFPENPTGGVQLPNGSWMGSVGLLTRGEVDFVGVPSTVNDQRLKVIDYTMYVDMDKQVMMHKKPLLEANISGFVNPFTLNVWTLIALGLVLVSLGTWLLQKAQNEILRESYAVKESHSSSVWWTACLWTVCAALSQSSFWSPRGGALRLLTGTWLLMAFILSIVYRSNLKAMIIIPKIHFPFNSLEEMLHTDIKCFVPLGSIIHLLMQKAARGSQLDRLWKPAVVHLNVTKAIHDTFAGKHATITSNHNINYLLHNAFARSKTCEAYVAEEAFITGFSASLGLPKGSPLKHQLNRILESLHESGVLNHLYHSAVPYASLCLHAGSFGRPNNNLRPLELGDFYGVLSVYAGGMVIAAILLLVEMRSPPRPAH
ncbi:glutamate receptor ionotropic, kainate glr-3-like [Eriocheir sinensis]|uniref:glutamate receptor ionotropic, kainate glr-3-like n=1 Tax=Eriocheir sinensis TaxID=95602 RepID=UPI0021C9C5D0|nr:glutamate receptor ionotropic, kainate glr-3-like [Eriocheir sinensis]